MFWNKLFPKDLSRADILIRLIIAVTTASIAVITFINSQSPRITVMNHLALKVDVYIAGEYRGQVQANSSRKFALFSADKPVEVSWQVIRQKNTEGNPIGDIMNGSFKSVANGQDVPITNITTKGEFFFFPVLSNQTKYSCKIYVNYSKASEKYVGVLNPGAKNVYAGYYKWIDASNVTLICKDNTLYWWGDIKGNRVKELNVQNKSGISYLTLFIEESP